MISRFISPNFYNTNYFRNWTVQKRGDETKQIISVTDQSTISTYNPWITIVATSNHNGGGVPVPRDEAQLKTYTLTHYILRQR